MRILHVVDSLEPGGMENGVVNLANGLQHECPADVACLRRKGAFAERLPRSSRVYELGKRGGFSPESVLRLAATIWRSGAQLIHTHNLGPLIYASLATMGGRTCPIVHGEHSLLTDEEKSPRRLEQRRSFYGSCRAVHTVAPLVKDELLQLRCGHPRLHVIPNGVDTARFSAGDASAARRLLGLPEEGVSLGIVGRFGQHKGHGVLLDAFEAVSGAHPDLHLVIAGGGGPLESAIRERAAAHPFATRIHFTGFLANPVPLYRAIDLLVIPSTNEGMANVALEAMACRTPVLANVGCGHEAIIQPGANGLIEDLRTADSLADALRRALSSRDELRTIAERAVEKVQRELSLEGMMRAYASLYAECIGQAPAKAAPAGTLS